MSITLEHVLDQAIEEGFLEAGSRFVANSLLAQEQEPAKVAVRWLAFAKRHGLKNWFEIKKRYGEASPQELSIIEEAVRPPKTLTEVIDEAIMAGVIEPSEKGFALVILQQQKEMIQTAQAIFTFAQAQNIKGWMAIWTAYQKRNQSNATEIIHEVSNSPKASRQERLEQVAARWAKSEDLVVRGSVELFYLWEEVCEEKVDLYEFFQEVEEIVGQERFNRKWVLEKFHIGEVIVKVCRHCQVSIEDLLAEKRFCSASKWRDLHGILVKHMGQRLKRSDKSAGRPLEILGESIPENLTEILKGLIASKAELETLKLPAPSKNSKEKLGSAFQFEAVRLDASLVKILKTGAVVIPGDQSGRRSLDKRLKRQLEKIDTARARLLQVKEHLEIATISGQ
jgi:hypothetical protein